MESNYGFHRILDQSLIGTALTDFSWSTSLSPTLRPRWMWDHYEEKVEGWIDVQFQAHQESETDVVRLAKTNLRFANPIFVRFHNTGLFPPNPLIDFGLPAVEHAKWDSPNYGVHFGTGARPALWESVESPLSELVKARGFFVSRNAEVKGSYAHYVLMAEYWNIELLAILIPRGLLRL